MIFQEQGFEEISNNKDILTRRFQLSAQKTRAAEVQRSTK